MSPLAFDLASTHVKDVYNYLLLFYYFVCLMQLLKGPQSGVEAPANQAKKRARQRSSSAEPSSKQAHRTLVAHTEGPGQPQGADTGCEMGGLVGCEMGGQMGGEMSSSLAASRDAPDRTRAKQQCPARRTSTPQAPPPIHFRLCRLYEVPVSHSHFHSHSQSLHSAAFRCISLLINILVRFM